MRIFLAGASGTIGRRLIPMLVGARHEVVGMKRTPSKTAVLRDPGVEPVVADALDTAAVMAAIQQAKPEVVVHELTAIPSHLNFRKFDREFELTNCLRIEGTDNLISSARAAGARRFVAQSYAGWPYARRGSWVKTEEEPLDPNPPSAMRRTLAAIRHLESAALGVEGMKGLVLRYGAF